MTQADAKNELKRIHKNLKTAYEIGLNQRMFTIVSESLKDIENILNRLESPKQPKPNCRPATPEELAALCASTNVVFLQPAA